MPDARTLEWRELLTQHLENRNGDRLDLAALRDFVDRFVAQEKDEGRRSEQVIRALKEITAPAIRLQVPPDQRSRISDHVFQWCLDAYYGASTARENFNAANNSASPERV